MDEYDEINEMFRSHCMLLQCKYIQWSVNNASYSTQIVKGLSCLCAKMYSLSHYACIVLQCAQHCSKGCQHFVFECSIRVFDFIYVVSIHTVP